MPGAYRKLYSAAATLAVIVAIWPLSPLYAVRVRKDADFGDVYQPGKDVVVPQMLLRVDPQYPPGAKHVPGTVEITMVIDNTGVPRKLQIKKHLKPELDQAAVDALKQWRFKPGMHNGDPVAVDATILVTFHPL